MKFLIKIRWIINFGFINNQTKTYGKSYLVSFPMRKHGFHAVKNLIYMDMLENMKISKSPSKWGYQGINQWNNIEHWGICKKLVSTDVEKLKS